MTLLNLPLWVSVSIKNTEDFKQYEYNKQNNSLLIVSLSELTETEKIYTIQLFVKGREVHTSNVVCSKGMFYSLEDLKKISIQNLQYFMMCFE